MQTQETYFDFVNFECRHKWKDTIEINLVYFTNLVGFIKLNEREGKGCEHSS